MSAHPARGTTTRTTRYPCAANVTSSRKTRPVTQPADVRRAGRREVPAASRLATLAGRHNEWNPGSQHERAVATAPWPWSAPALRFSVERFVGRTHAPPEARQTAETTNRAG